MSEFERQKLKRRGALADDPPVCGQCGKPSVLDPCRSCAPTTEAKDQPLFPEGETE